MMIEDEVLYIRHRGRGVPGANEEAGRAVRWRAKMRHLRLGVPRQGRRLLEGQPQRRVEDNEEVRPLLRQGLRRPQRSILTTGPMARAGGSQASGETVNE